MGADIVLAMTNPFGPAALDSTVTQDGAGNYLGANMPELVWTGVAWKGTADKDTCRDWTSSAATDSGTGGCVAGGWDASGICSSTVCDNSGASVFLECVEL